MTQGSADEVPEPPRGPGVDIRGKGASGVKERVVEKVLLACGIISIITTLGILSVLAFETFEFFQEVSLIDYLGETEWTPLFANKKFGVWPLVAGTLLTSVIAISVALPFGLLAAIYLSEFASDTARQIFKPALEILAGVPTIVYGYFALVFITPILRMFIPEMSGYNALSPGIIMGVMIIPMISSLSEDAIYAVPNSLREAAYGLGAGKLQTIFRVVLPSAKSGIAAAFTLAISRAIGETMIVVIAAGQRPQMTLDPREPVQTMTAFIVQISKGDVPTGTIEYKTIFVVGATLFLMTFVMNMISQRLARGGRQ
ncbi:MAG: phosphate ABC transporter permease subunit PstC [Myxococcota bacterium]